MKKLLQRTMLLLFALIAGSSSLWADEAVFTFNTDDGLTALGITKPESGKGTNLSTSAYTISGLSMTVTNGTGTATRVWNSNGATDLRIYNGSKLTFEAPTGKYITSIVLAGAAVNVFSANDGSFSAGTWAGSSNSVELTATGTGKINTITITYGEPASILAPTSNVSTGAYVEAQDVTLSCETEGAEIRYTTDGSAPSAGSTLYSSAIHVDATTTIKAIAIKGAALSSAIEVTITIPTTTYSTLAEVKSAGETTNPFILNLTNAQVLAVNGSNDMYVKDASGALDFYKTGLTYTAGKLLNGKIAVTGYKIYQGTPEITGIGENKLTATDGELNPIILASTEDATLENYVCQLISVTGTAKGDKKINDLPMYQKFSGVTNTNLDNLIADVNNITVTGILLPYNSTPQLYPTKIVYNITLTKDMMTYASGNKLDYTSSGLTVYTAKVTNGAAVLTELANNQNSLKIVNYGTGVILSGTAGNTYSVPMTTENVSGTSGNELKGVTAETEVAYSADSKYNYILQNGVFKKATGDKLKAGKAYLQTTYDVTAAGAPTLAIVIDGETTGIGTSLMNSEQRIVNSVYNLNGQRVAQPSKGLYIVNGRKVIVK